MIPGGHHYANYVTRSPLGSNNEFTGSIVHMWLVYSYVHVHLIVQYLNTLEHPGLHLIKAHCQHLELLKSEYLFAQLEVHLSRGIILYLKIVVRLKNWSKVVLGALCWLEL